MSQHRHRTLSIAVSLFLLTCLCGPPTAFAEEPSPPTPSSQETVAPSTESVPPPEAGEVQERGVTRDHRTQKPRQTDPAAAKPTDKSSIGIFQPGIQFDADSVRSIHWRYRPVACRGRHP